MTYMDRYPYVPGSRAGAPETSEMAAASVVDAAKSRSTQALAYVACQARNGATADEVAEAFEWDRYSSRPRLAELHGRGAIVDSGNRRQGVSGRKQVVWVLPEYGPLPPPDAQAELPGV
jgi:hypothetical protein